MESKNYYHATVRRYMRIYHEFLNVNKDAYITHTRGLLVAAKLMPENLKDDKIKRKISFLEKYLAEKDN